MPPKFRVQISARVTGANRVAAILRSYRNAIGIVIAQGRVETLLLRRTKDRFAPAGTNARAQRDPSGRPWKELAPSTLLRRKGDPKRKLYQSGALLNSIDVVRRNMTATVLRSASGGGFSIGIRPGSQADKYARIHQFGGYAGRGNKVRIPARRYLGIGKADAVAVRRMMRREFNRVIM